MHFDLKNQPSPELPFFVTPGHGARKVLTRHEGETVAMVRDLAAETEALETFSEACPGLDAAGVGYQYLDGSTPLGQRADAVSRFQRGEGDLFLISLKTGGTGLNLTAANYVVLLDPWWNPAVETQAADRAHRIGQRNPVTVYRLVTADTVEERVVALHAKKLALAESLLDDTADTRLSANDLLSLLKS